VCGGWWSGRIFFRPLYTLMYTVIIYYNITPIIRLALFFKGGLALYFNPPLHFTSIPLALHFKGFLLYNFDTFFECF
jgi:hypothetical protein